jgi:very-short-patch-repair endonuclease
MIDHDVAELSAQQCGTFARFQILDLGGTDRLIQRRTNAGRWLTFRPGVYGFPGHRDTFDKRLWIVYLAAGQYVAVSYDSAAAQYGAPGFARDALHLTVPHPHHQRVRGATVHQTRHLPSHHVVLLWGRRTTTYARTLVDLAPTTSRAKLDLAFQHGIITGRLTLGRMARTFEDLYVPGRRGMVKLGGVIDERATGERPPSSELERLLYEMCARVGLRPERQYPHPGLHGLEGCVDGALPDAKLIVEADGRRWHTRVADFSRDRDRDNQATRVGWDTLRFPWEELVGDAEDAAATLVDTYELRRDLFRRAS